MGGFVTPAIPVPSTLVTTNALVATVMTFRADSVTGAASTIVESYGTAPGTGITIRIARGTFASPSDLLSGDRTGTITLAGYAGGAFRTVCSITGFVGTGTISSTSLPTYLSFATTPNGSVTRVERVRIDQNGHFLMFGGAVGLSLLTVATLPSAPAPGYAAAVSDALVPVIGSAVAAGGSAFAAVMWNGTIWSVFSK